MIKADRPSISDQAASGRLFLSPPHMSGREIEYVKQAFESNFIAPAGPQLNLFEDRFCEASGFEHCVAVVNGTAAIHLILRHLGVGPGDIVLASTLTFVGSVAPVIYQGAELVFIDSDPDTWNMDPSLLEQEIKRLMKVGKKPAAVIPTELYGLPCDLDRIIDICSPHGIPVVCDCAESLGASYRGRPVGTGATAAAFSFNGNKIITTSGGGMVASDDPKLVDNCRYLATQARQPVLHYEHHDLGYNYRMSNVVASIGLGQLEVLKKRVEKKHWIAEAYERELADIDGIAASPSVSYSKGNHWLSVILIDESIAGFSPLELIAALDSENIESRPVWNPLHLHKVFSNCRSVGGAVAESLFRRGVCLPSGTQMGEQDLKRVCQVVKGLAAQ